MTLHAHASHRQTWLEANTAHQEDARLSESDYGAALSVFSPEWDDCVNSVFGLGPAFHSQKELMALHKHTFQLLVDLGQR